MRRKVLLAGGIVAPLLYAAGDVAGGLSWREYSFRDQTISELGAIDAPSRTLFSAFVIPSYAALLAFGVGVWRSAGGDRRLRIAGGLLIVFSTMALTFGQFAAMRGRGTEQGTAGALHLIEGAIAMVMILAAQGFAAGALGRRFRVYTIVTIGVMLVFGGWSSSSGPRIAEGLDTPWIGVVERAWWYAYQTWFAVLAIALLRRSVAARPRAAHAEASRRPSATGR